MKYLALFAVLTFLSLPAYAQDYSRMGFEGFKKLKPTQICSKMDLILLMQDAHKQLKAGSSANGLALFKGTVPPANLTSPPLPSGKKKFSPENVFDLMLESLQLYSSKTSVSVTVPDKPSGSIFPGHVFTVTSILFDSLGGYLQSEGVTKVGDLGNLGYRYVNRLKPSD